MNISQAYDAVKLLKISLSELFLSVELNFPFIEGRPTIGDKSIANMPGILITGDGIGCKSGIYLIASPNEEILYIGKATKNNLHHRVWGHLKTPETLKSGHWAFPKNEFESFTSEAEHVKNVREGNVKIGVITISNPEVVSLVEVYLHTLHMQKFGRLPLFNKQIG